MSLSDQQIAEMTPQEPRASGDENTHGCVSLS
jgi:hypothetical protein